MRTDEKSSGQAAAVNQSIAIIPISLALAVVALLLFVGLSQEVLRSGTDRFDQNIRAAVHAQSSPALTAFFRALTNLGDWMVLVPACLLVGLFFYLRGLRQQLRLLLVTMAGALLLDAALKVVVRRPRPVPFFIPEPSTYSFPSGHALVSFCFYGLLAGMTALQLKATWQKAAVWTGAGALIGLIGLSRIYLGVHWPSDVLAGYAAAIVWLGAIRAVALRERRQSAARTWGGPQLAGSPGVLYRVNPDSGEGHDSIRGEPYMERVQGTGYRSMKPRTGAGGGLRAARRFFGPD